MGSIRDYDLLRMYIPHVIGFGLMLLNGGWNGWKGDRNSIGVEDGRV